MDDRERNDMLFDTLARVLIRSALIGAAFLLLWFLVFLVGADWMYGAHSKWFDISKHEFQVMNYYAMAFVKMCLGVFFLFPYLSIRLVLWKKKERV